MNNLFCGIPCIQKGIFNQWSNCCMISSLEQDSYRPGKPGKLRELEMPQEKPGKLGEFHEKVENSGNFIKNAFKSAFLAIWDEQISNFSPTMVDNLSPFLAMWDKEISKFSPTMVDN